MDKPTYGRVHVGTGMDSSTRTACWSTAYGQRGVVGTGQISGRTTGQQDGQGENIIPRCESGT